MAPLVAGLPPLWEAVRRELAAFSGTASPLPGVADCIVRSVSCTNGISLADLLLACVMRVSPKRSLLKCPRIHADLHGQVEPLTACVVVLATSTPLTQAASLTQPARRAQGR
jgi:hypothetical protein